MRSKTGFTIVELLIVIVVIAILASISVVAYTGFQQRARNTSRISEARQWMTVLDSYKALNGTYPAVPTGSYCLGSNFPIGYAGQRRCRNYGDSDANISYQESNNASLMSALSTVGTISAGNRSPVQYVVGPYLEYWNTGYRISIVLEGSAASECPSGFSYNWTNGSGVLICSIQV